jgi:tetratricopeptide (TPR) repeat protein
MADDHTILGLDMMRLGSYHAKAGKYEESLSHLKKAYSIFDTSVPNSHHMSDCHFFLAFTFLRIGDAAQARRYIMECLRMRSSIFPTGNKSITEAENLMKDITEQLEKSVAV